MSVFFFFVKQKTAYEMRISDWSSDVCSSDLLVYTPGTMTEGAVTVDAWVQNVETGGVQMVSTGTGTLAVNMSNDGVAIDNEAVTGSESAATDTTADSLIELPGLSVTLNDDDGSEDIVSILRSEEHTSELQSLMRSSYAVFCSKKKKNKTTHY